jgi:hypothetical protein
MDRAHYEALLADLRRFLELPAVRQEFHGQLEPDGSAFKRAVEALTELEREALNETGGA